MDTEKQEIIRSRVDDYFLSLGFTKEEEGRFLRKSDQYIDLITYGFAEKSPWVIGAIRMSRKICYIERMWEDMEEYFRSRKTKFNATIFSDPSNERDREPVNTLKIEGTINELWEIVINFFISVTDTYLLPDIKFKSDINNLFVSLNIPYNKPVIGSNWIRKIIVAKLIEAPNSLLIYDYVYDRFEKLYKKGDEKSGRILKVLEIVRDRMKF